MKPINNSRPVSGQPVDLAPWGYLWRRDRARQTEPEANFIPRRLERLDRVYRTALREMGPEQTKSVFYRQDDLLADFLPAPADPLLTGLLWVGGASDVTLTISFPGPAPDPDLLDVRAYPTAWGWFGWTVDCRMQRVDEACDGQTLVYRMPPGLTMDFAYNHRVPAATEMVAVFVPAGTAVPALSLTGGSFGVWRPLRVRAVWEVERDRPFTGEALTHVAVAERVEFDPAGRTAVFDCLYSAEARYGCDSRLTLPCADGETGVTVLLREVAEGPVFVPAFGLYLCREDAWVSPADWLAAHAGRQNVRQRVRSHPEQADWQTVMRRMRLDRCGVADCPALPPAPPTQFDVRLPDPGWQAVYAHAVEQLRGPHMWGRLSSEVGRVLLAMEYNGLFDEADRLYDYYLASPGVKTDGDFLPDAAGSFEHGEGMRHDMGYLHEGTHSNPGKILLSMSRRWWLTGDDGWLQARLPRLKAAADWIIRERRSYLADWPDRDRLQVAGLMPPQMLGDYALPACDWHWYYSDNAYDWMGLAAFADLLKETGDPDAARYRREADFFAGDLRRAVRRETLFAPVRQDSAGFSHPFIPRMAYAGGLLHFGQETNIPQFAMGINDLFDGALPLAEAGGLLDPLDEAVDGTLTAMEERGTALSLGEVADVDHPTADGTTRRQESGGGQTENADWFWSSFSNLPKISHNADLYLWQDDIPGFLRFFTHHAALMVGRNGKLWEHTHPDSFGDCDAPDNGTAGWIAGCVRHMLVHEWGDTLWLFKGTPRAWLSDGCTLSFAGAPTLFGRVGCTAVSHVAQGFLTVSLTPALVHPPAAVRLRLRLPDGLRLTGADCPGAVVRCEPDGETLRLSGLSGPVTLTAYCG